MGLTFSIFVILKFMLFAGIIFLVFRTAPYTIPVIFKKISIIKLILKYLPFLEVIVWIIFSIWAFSSFLVQNQYFAIALFIIVLIISIWASRLFLKDYIAGIIIKSNSDINIGEFITVSEYYGQIKKFNFRTIEIELENNKVIFFPYSKILNLEIIKEQKAESLIGYTFILNLSKSDEPNKIILKLRESILFSPWASLKKDPVIKLLNETNSSYIFELTVYAINREMNINIENYLKEKYSLK